MVRQPRDDKQKNEVSFLSRWSLRKEQITKGEIKPDNELDNTPKSSDETELEQEEVLTDIELLEKYKLPNPEKVKSEAGLTRFLDDDLPERIRQMALRRLWHLNPLFGEVCEMVEYGEDYTDAATVIEGMQTAYQVGKGYEVKAEKSKGSDVPEDDVPEDDVAEDDVAEDDVVKRDPRQNELAKKIIDVIEDGVVFKDNAFGVSGTDVEDYILPKNDVDLPHKEEAVIEKDSGSYSRQGLESGDPTNISLSSRDASDGFDDGKDIKDTDQSLQAPVSRTRPSRMNFKRSKDNF